MPSIYDLKSRFQNLLRPLNAGLVKRGVTANQVTIAALVLSALSGLCIVLFPAQQWPLLAIPFVLFLRMALNAIDGMLAREHDMKTPLGAVLNELGDVFSDIVLYLPFGLVAGVCSPLVTGVVILGIISEMTGVVGVQIGASRRYDGPMGKSDRAFAFGLLALLLGLGVSGGAWVSLYLAAMFVLTGITILNRAKHALKELAE